MDIKELVKNLKNLTDYQIEQKLSSIMRDNSKYKNLDEGNRKIVLGILKKYKANLRQGIGISQQTLFNEHYHLHQNMIKLNLTEEDLKDIKEILSYFHS